MSRSEREQLFAGSQLSNSMNHSLSERIALEQTSSLIDHAFEVNLQTQRNLDEQDRTLQHAKRNLDQIILKIPYVGDLSKKILLKRKRDRIILGSLIGFLMFVLVWYLFG